MRKHLYLITEHQNDDHIGRMKFTDTRLNRGKKNEETPITALNEDKSDFVEVGKQVHCGYYDFESEAAFEDTDNVVEVMEDKLAEIDERWKDKAGVDI